MRNYLRKCQIKSYSKWMLQTDYGQHYVAPLLNFFTSIKALRSFFIFFQKLLNLASSKFIIL